MRWSAMPVRRPRLEALLDRALGHRLTLLIADSGFGKTTLLTSWSAGINATILDVTDDSRDLAYFSRQVAEALRLRVPDLPRELTVGLSGRTHPPDSPGDSAQRPDAAAELIGRALEQHLFRDVALVIDNAHLLGDGTALRFLDGIVRHAPPLLHIVVSSRVELALPLDRLRQRGEVFTVHGSDLRFTEAEVDELLGSVLPEPSDLAAGVIKATTGWPIAVRLTIESLRPIDPARRPTRLGQLASGRNHITELVRDAFAREPAEMQWLLAAIGLFDEADTELLDWFRDYGRGRSEQPVDRIESARELVTAMLRRGLYLEPGASGPGWVRVHAVAAGVVARDGPITSTEVEQLLTAAAHWFREQRRPREALRALAATSETRLIAGLLADVGQQLLNQGFADDVTRVAESLPGAERGGSVERLLGEAYQLRGNWEKSLDCYRRVAADAESLDAGLAWRMGLIHYLRGELDQAIQIYQRVDLGDPSDVGTAGDADTALLLAWHASAHWKLGETDSCGKLIARALRVATEVDDPRGLAAVHTVLGMLAVSEGDRRANDAHYLKAVENAERAGDVLQLVRIRCNRGSHLVEEGDYEQALAELDIAIRLADLSGFASFGALALNNRGEANLALSRLEEAQRDFGAAAEAFRRLGSAQLAYPLTQLGILHQLRGESVEARRALEEALSLAERARDVQATVPALAALALLIADSDLARARELARRAVAIDAGLGVVDALLAAGWVELAGEDPRSADEFARRAGEAAAARRHRRGAAHALVLRAHCTQDPCQARDLAAEAAAACEQLGDTVGWARASLALIPQLTAAAARPKLSAVRQRMRAIGCRLLDAQVGRMLAELDEPRTSLVRVQTMGRFGILRGDQPVGGTAWKSGRARKLIKILVSRRGRAIGREQLMDLLWPEENPDQLANRFNVAISTARTLLDPERTLCPDGCIVVDSDSVRLEIGPLDVDIERFHNAADEGQRLLRENRVAEGIQLLENAEAAYTGEFCEEDPYDDWAGAVRDQARAAYQATVARLAEHARRHGQADAAVRYLLRVLERDPYDERTHLELISVLSQSGRHGEARRHYRTYCRRMEELGIDADPFRAA